MFPAVRRPVFAAALCAACISTGISAQQPVAPDEGAGAPVISANVDLVVLHATVRDSHGRFVSGLTANDFRVFENGSPQTIQVFSHEDVPVAAGLLVDSSGSMGPKRAAVIAGAREFVRKSNPGDRLFVLDFNEHVYSGMPNGKMFSSNPSDLERAIEAAPASGRTALYDAILSGYERLDQAQRDKKVLVVISDGGDNASRAQLRQVLERAGRSNVIVYAIGILDEDDEESNPGALKRIARATGGEAWFPKDLSEVTALCARIAEDIRNQYTIGYSPSDKPMDGTWRKITVIATDAKGRKFRVRTREGYVAAASAESKKIN